MKSQKVLVTNQAPQAHQTVPVFYITSNPPPARWFISRIILHFQLHRWPTFPLLFSLQAVIPWRFNPPTCMRLPRKYWFFVISPALENFPFEFFFLMRKSAPEKSFANNFFHSALCRFHACLHERKNNGTDSIKMFCFCDVLSSSSSLKRIPIWIH